MLVDGLKNEWMIISEEKDAMPKKCDRLNAKMPIKALNMEKTAYKKNKETNLCINKSNIYERCEMFRPARYGQKKYDATQSKLKQAMPYALVDGAMRSLTP